MVYRLPEDGGVPPKHVAVNNELYCYVHQIIIIIIIIIIIYLPANGLSPGGSGYNACT